MGRELTEFGRGLGPGELSPEPLLGSADLAQAKVPPGPRWGQLLALAEEQQLQGRMGGREAALAWLQRQLDDPS
jgi:hypothetical protein